jgi:hypothetical protein
VKECSTPPDRDVSWRALHVPSGRATFVMARTWMFARDEAARLMGVDRYDVSCEQMEIVTG